MFVVQPPITKMWIYGMSYGYAPRDAEFQGPKLGVLRRPQGIKLQGLMEAARKVCGKFGFFHWHLSFSAYLDEEGNLKSREGGVGSKSESW
jgi:hypothetical protein